MTGVTPLTRTGPARRPVLKVEVMGLEPTTSASRIRLGRISADDRGLKVLVIASRRTTADDGGRPRLTATAGYPRDGNGTRRGDEHRVARRTMSRERIGRGRYHCVVVLPIAAAPLALLLLPLYASVEAFRFPTAAFADEPLPRTAWVIAPAITEAFFVALLLGHQSFFAGVMACASAGVTVAYFTKVRTRVQAASDTTVRAQRRGLGARLYDLVFPWYARR